MNALFSLPPKRVDDVLVVPLPPPEMRLPRSKPLPKPRPPTKWEQYAKEKGIEKKKKTKLVRQRTAKTSLLMPHLLTLIISYLGLG